MSYLSARSLTKALYVFIVTNILFSCALSDNTGISRSEWRSSSIQAESSITVSGSIERRKFVDDARLLLSSREFDELATFYVKALAEEILQHKAELGQMSDKALLHDFVGIDYRYSDERVIDENTWHLTYRKIDAPSAIHSYRLSFIGGEYKIIEESQGYVIGF